MIGILDYGVGNINAFINIYSRLKISHKRIRFYDDFSQVTHLILPGVGAFDHTMEKYNDSGLRDIVEKKVMDEKLPILGVCVGMQMLAADSEEGNLKGLHWIDAHVRKLSFDSTKYRLPHMGWNDVILTQENRLMEFEINNPRFYFLHSYYVDCNNDNDVIARTEYGFNFCCAVKHENIYGTQFHPEKSHSFGTNLLENFSRI